MNFPLNSDLYNWLMKPTPQDAGVSDLDLERARWHITHGTKEFREFLGLGEADVEVLFAKWLKENIARGVAHP